MPEYLGFIEIPKWFYLKKKPYTYEKKGQDKLCQENKTCECCFVVLTLTPNVTFISNPCDKRTMDLLTWKKTERIWLLYNWSGFISPVFFGIRKLIPIDRHPLIRQPLIYHWNYGKHCHFSSDLRTYIKAAAHTFNCCYRFSLRKKFPEKPSQSLYSLELEYKTPPQFCSFGDKCNLIFCV